MATRKTGLDRIEDIDKKIQQLSRQKKEIEAKEKEKARKARTRRLIEIGALSEKYFNCEDIEPIDYETLLSKLVALDPVKSILATNKNNSN